MTYQQFIDAVEKKIKEEVAEEVAVQIYTAEKNNGVIKKGIMLSEKGSGISPTIYLEEYYKEYIKGKELNAIVKDLLKVYHQVRLKKNFEVEKMDQYSAIKSRIIYRLVNRKNNANMLRGVPYIEYMDLAIIFCVLLEVTEYNTATLTIRNEHLHLWGVTKEEVYEQAEKNTWRILPDEFVTMKAVMEEICRDPAIMGKDVLYILSNKIHSYGASVILYPERLSGISAYLKDDFYIIPSSVHEVLIVSQRDSPKWEDLSAMVKEVNTMQVEPEDILSDHAYYYDNKQKKLFESRSLLYR